MVLVDTSVLIDYLGTVENSGTRAFQSILDSGIAYGITSFTYMEILQGVRTEREFELVKRYLDTQKFYGFPDEKASFAEAARIYFLCRKRGITISSTIDCLIARAAIENDIFLLHNDKDFDSIAKVVKLKIFRK
jgi:predicted nucleic acid-binding protein